MQLATTRSKRAAFFVTALLLAVALGSCGDDDPSGPGDFPDVRGEWIGQYSVVGCEALTGLDPFFCADLFYAGRSLILEVNLEQSGSSVSGIAVQGAIAGQVAGTVDDVGLVTLSGQLGVGDDATTTIEDWQSLLVGDSLVGSWLFLVEDNAGNDFGSARVDADLTLVGPDVLTFFNCPVQTWLAQTDEVSGALEAGDCMLEDESYYDVYAIDVSPGDQIELQMATQGFQPTLFITDVDEALLGCSSVLASPVCLKNPSDSLAVVALEAVVAETWLIIANAFFAEETGTYTLTTARLGGAGVSATVALQRVPIETRGVLGNEREAPSSSMASYREFLVRKFATRGDRLGKVKLEGIK